MSDGSKARSPPGLFPHECTHRQGDIARLNFYEDILARLLTRVAIEPGFEERGVDFQKRFKQPDVVEKIESQGGTIYGGTPDSFAAYIRTDTVKWDKLIKSANIKLD